MIQRLFPSRDSNPDLRNWAAKIIRRNSSRIKLVTQTVSLRRKPDSLRYAN